MALDVSKSGSRFFSPDYAKTDSVLFQSIQNQSHTGGEIIVSSSSFIFGSTDIVQKDYAEGKVYNYPTISYNRYKTREERKLSWELKNEKKVIGEFHTQKATVDFAGRRWIAWFTTQIPIQDGPYIFTGLPGLIIRIEDSGGSYSYNLVGIEKISKRQDQYLKKWAGSKYKTAIPVNYERFRKAWQDSRNFAGNTDFNLEGVVVQEVEDDLIADSKRKRDANRSIEQEKQKFNNPLDLDLFK